MNKTQMAAKIKNGVGDRLFKVVFTKAPEANAMADLIRSGSELIEKSDATAEEKRKAYKALWERSQKGEIRIMRGYIKRTEGGMDIEEVAAKTPEKIIRVAIDPARLALPPGAGPPAAFSHSSIQATLKPSWAARMAAI